MRSFAASLTVAALLALPWLTALGVHAQEPFVRTEGTAFMLGETPFSFVGANVAVMHGPVHRAALDATLDAVQADGGRVIRVWALGEYEAAAPPWADLYAFRRGDLFVEGAFEQLDRVLVACQARGLRVIVVLANRWGDYGGLPQYLRWAGVPFPGDGSVLGDLSLPLFFSSSGARALYLAHVREVVSHTNAQSGLPYRDDPTIFAWELWNEISAPPRARADLVALLEEAAAEVRAIDRHHLVSAGHIGYQLARDRRTWEAAISARGIDYADAHAYPTRYGHVRDLRQLDRWVAERARIAREHDQPLLFGEVGFHARRAFDVPRARFLDRFFAAARRYGAAGVLPWIYAPSGDHPREYTVFFDGEDSESTRDLRRTIARHARRFEGFDPRTVPEPPASLPPRPLIGSGRVHRDWQEEPTGARLEIALEGFHRARFEAVGRSEGPRSAHLFGMGTGWVRFRFRAPLGPSRTLIVRFRASSELPGTGIGASELDTSEVVVRLDGLEIGRVLLPVDDGFGENLEVRTDAPAILERLRRGTHTIELAIEAPDAPGLCLYGTPVTTSDDDGERTEEPLSQLEVTVVR